MEVIPSIDIRAGRCVRLYQGDYARETVYDEDPVAVAGRWQDAGATTLHVVDLDGARTGEQTNLPVIERIAARLRIDLQIGGGVRTVEIAERLLGIGARRVVFGTTAVRQPEVVDAAVARFGDAIAVGIDARDGKATTDGWRNAAATDALSLARAMAARGVERIIYTDIGVDGTLTQPNYAGTAEVVAAARPAAVVASGGVATVEHLRELSKTGVVGTIVGRSLYAGTLDLAEAIRAC
jgi:phosphoribosylformimino-5-aminoimidazole carboxamide ribotide isomerase